MTERQDGSKPCQQQMFVLLKPTWNNLDRHISDCTKYANALISRLDVFSPCRCQVMGSYPIAELLGRVGGQSSIDFPRNDKPA